MSPREQALIDRATQVLKTFPLFVFKLFTEDERQETIAVIAAYGQEQYRAGVEVVLKFFEEGDENTMWRPHEITDAIECLLTEQEEKG